MTNPKNPNTPVTNRSPFLVISILLLLSLHSASADEKFVTGICSGTTIPELCQSVLLSDPRSTQATTIDALSLIAFDISISAATAANRQADDLARQYRGTPQQNPLGQCTAIYLDLMNELQTGKSFAESSSFTKANYAAVDARMKPDACETEFVSRNLDSLLLQTDEDLTKKCDVCMSLTQLVIG